jgi:hypothetical protein
MGRKNKIYSPRNYDKCRELGEKAHKERLARLGAEAGTTRAFPTGEKARLARAAARAASKQP